MQRALYTAIRIIDTNAVLCMKTSSDFINKLKWDSTFNIHNIIKYCKSIGTIGEDENLQEYGNIDMPKIVFRLRYFVLFTYNFTIKIMNMNIKSMNNFHFYIRIISLLNLKLRKFELFFNENSNTPNPRSIQFLSKFRTHHLLPAISVVEHTLQKVQNISEASLQRSNEQRNKCLEIILW